MLTQRCCISVVLGVPGAEMRGLRLVIVLPEFPSHPGRQPSQFRARSTVALPIFSFFKPPSLLGPSGLIYSYLFLFVSRLSFLSFAVVTTSSSGFLLFTLSLLYLFSFLDSIDHRFRLLTIPSF